MAKSLRSKRKRKMRAIKRERYGAKELDTLKQIVKQAKRKKSNQTQTNVQGNKDNNNGNYSCAYSFQIYLHCLFIKIIWTPINLK